MSDLQRAIKKIESFIDWPRAELLLDDRLPYTRGIKKALRIALAALREKAERENGCHACRDHMVQRIKDSVHVGIDKDMFTHVAIKNPQDQQWLNAKIKVTCCYNCGHPLETDDHQDYIDTPEDWARRKLSNETKPPDSLLSAGAEQGNESRDTLEEERP